MSDSAPNEDSILLGDCAPYSFDAYESFVADPKKLESHGKQPLTIDRFSRCARQNVEVVSLLFGAERKKERLTALETMAEPHESHPELFSIQFLR